LKIKTVSSTILTKQCLWQSVYISEKRKGQQCIQLHVCAISDVYNGKKCATPSFMSH